MRRLIRHTLMAFVPLAALGCASTGDGGAAAGTTAAIAGGNGSQQGLVALTRTGEAVQVTDNAESTWECEFITDLPLGSTFASDPNAIRELRNEAGRRGANLVLLVLKSRDTIERAEGYLCAD